MITINFKTILNSLPIVVILSNGDVLIPSIGDIIELDKSMFKENEFEHAGNYKVLSRSNVKYSYGEFISQHVDYPDEYNYF